MLLAKRLRRHPRGRRWAARLLAALLALGLLLAVQGPLLRAMADALIVEDPLERGEVIIVLGGGMPFREMEAARLYREGWAPRVMLVREAQQERQRLLTELGVPAEWEQRVRVLERLGVPDTAVAIPDGEAFGTLEELQAAAAGLPQGGGGVALLVTSSFHTRRTGLVWRATAPPGWRAAVRSAPADPFDPAIWQRDRRFALAVAQEYLGLLNFWAGSPVTGRPAGQR